MADRRCALCGHYYTDEDGHDYTCCVSFISSRIRELTWELVGFRAILPEAIYRRDKQQKELDKP